MDTTVFNQNLFVKLSSLGNVAQSFETRGQRYTLHCRDKPVGCVEWWHGQSKTFQRNSHF